MDGMGPRFFSGVASGTCFQLCLILTVSYASRFKTEFHSLPDCGLNFKQEHNVTETLNDTPVLTCARQCSRTSGCSGFNFCQETDNNTCELLGYVVDVPTTTCQDLVWQPGCIYYQRKVCSNGGRYNVGEGSCACALGFKGPHCEELWKDCIDGHALIGDDVHAFVTIRPRLNGPAFTVLCDGSRTIVAHKNRVGSQFFTDKTWNDYRNGFFRSATYAFANFWIGLEGMHQLSISRNFVLHVALGTYDSNVTGLASEYTDIRIENEAQNYTLRYSQYVPAGGHFGWMDDGLGGTTGNDTSRDQPFCTLDRDCGDCAKNSNSAWWFNTDCSYVNPLGLRDSFVWPVNGEMVALQFLQMVFE